MSCNFDLGPDFSGNHQVLSEINSYGMINVLEIFQYLISAKDAEIKARYGSEMKALEAAEKTLSIIKQCNFLCDDNLPLCASIKVTKPISTGDTVEKTYLFSQEEVLGEGKIDFISDGGIVHE